MKTIVESIFNDEDIINNANNYNIDKIEDWIYDNFICSGVKIDIIDNRYIVNAATIECKNHNIKLLTNGLFCWGIVDNFNIDYCRKLVSLKDGPTYINKNFSMIYCTKLKNLEGGPEYIGGWMSCNNCDSLESLKGFPKKIKGSATFIDCKNLKLSESDINKYKKICQRLFIK